MVSIWIKQSSHWAKSHFWHDPGYELAWRSKIAGQ